MLITRQARDLYRFEDDLFKANGHLNMESHQTARRFAAQMSAVRGEPVPASDIYAMAVLDEAIRIVYTHYLSPMPGLTKKTMEHMKTSLEGKLDQVLAGYLDVFPSLDLYRDRIPLEASLRAAINSPENAIQDLLLTDNHNSNPAIRPYIELHDDAPLKESGAYPELLTGLREFFTKRPAMVQGDNGESLYEALAAPARFSPDSLEGQIKYVIDRWGLILGDDFIQRLLRAMDYIHEDVVRRTRHIDENPEVHVPSYPGELEYERYSPDREWMLRLVLIAKNTYVWLEQLSRKYQRWIRTLDQIPDEELDLMAKRGFTGLWLIGLWERSRASLRIKQRMGDPDAVASAYSLNSYDIARDLGGWEAMQHLRTRAWQRGIRLSADMVPNHMGIDSEWVIQHPDWFLSLPYPAYTNYSFTSENLSDDDRVGIHIEDHYYNHTDAAVVFQRRDRWTGEVRYIYHGNDGTAFPWNDTAQLDYTRPEVREAVIQTILHVARNFPIIRFDAAMTLARRHIQRLWFPEPGGGGAIPSRAERGMTRAEFDRKVPEEFWREVVDRVAAEVPDTLLLAEAFWLMEGYFVRTLGMHRVYNSAFMHMLRDEDNAKYRQLIKNTLEFDPQILKRYVNFMSNPDEKTAVEQFGSGDKYFGICTLLATLPGLPMFGHGQIEGFREKYGMEFRKPKWDEQPDEGLVRGHEWRVAPLLQKRYLFAEVESFQLFDYFQANGQVNEEVFAYSNRAGDERGLVIYHNKFADTRGWIQASAAGLDKATGNLIQKSLAEALGLPHEGYAIFKDYATQLEYIRACSEIWKNGFYSELGAYLCHVFLDWRIVEEKDWREVHDSLNGAGVESMQMQMEKVTDRRNGVSKKSISDKNKKTEDTDKESRRKKLIDEMVVGKRGKKTDEVNKNNAR